MTPEEVIDVYCTAWSEPDAGKRLQTLERVLTPDATYTDPRVHAESPARLSQHIGAVLATRPGARVLRISAVAAPHGKARFAWHLVDADGTALPPGLDIVAFDEVSGRLKTILGFFGPLPEMPS